jgi:hypothetical protein
MPIIRQKTGKHEAHPDRNPRDEVMDIFSRARRRIGAWRQQNEIARLARQVADHARSTTGQQPVVIFNASTRLADLSQNAAFALLAGWSLRLSGVPVIHFVCQGGMSCCVLGINRDYLTRPMPCAACIAQSRRLFAHGAVHAVTHLEDAELSQRLQGLNVEQLGAFEYPFRLPAQQNAAPLPLGPLVLTSARWALRRHTLPDDEPTRYLLRQYILSAYRISQEFAALLERVKPQAVILFNALFFPEAAAMWIARQMDVRAVAHEVGFQRFSTFFTEGEPTAYPIHIPEDTVLTAEQNARLDQYLEQRFQGKFSMAGIQFWPEMRGLDEAFLKKASGYRQIVPVFTNVIYDTSQAHANIVFPHMFAWLETVLEVIRSDPESLFVIRAHPDEMRPGTAKQSRESVQSWVIQSGAAELPNVDFIDSLEYISSYELIQRAKFVMVYSSSIGLEASLMGRPVLCGGKARYTQYPIVFFPSSPQAYRRAAEEFLSAEQILVPAEFQANARKFLYYQLYRASLPLDEYMQPAQRMGYVQLRSMSWEKLLPEQSPTLRVIVEGVLHGTPFLLPED